MGMSPSLGRESKKKKRHGWNIDSNYGVEQERTV